MGANTATVQKLYVAFFNRPGDALGQAFWEGKMDAGMTEAQVAASFAQSTEYTSVYGSLTTASVVSQLYTNLFGRAAAANEVTFWGLRLLNGLETVSSIALTLANNAQGTDATAISNKVSAATSFTNALTTTDQIVGYSGSAANAVAKTWLATVTSDAATLTAATSSLSTTISSAVSASTTTTGSTFTLSAGSDTLDPASATAASKSTSGDDTFRAPTDGFLTSADYIDGGAGNDTLTASITAASQTIAPVLKNVETVTLTVTPADTKTLTINASEFTGANTVSIKDAGAASMAAHDELITVSNLAKTTTLGIIGGTASTGTTASEITATFTGAAAADTQKVAISTLGKVGVLTLSTAETVEITATGTGTTGANTIGSLAATAVKTLNLKGAGDLTISASDLAATVTVDATASTGVVSFTGETAATSTTFKGGTGKTTFTTASTGTVSVTTGSANDTVDVSGGNSTATISTGAGDDRVLVGAASNVTSADVINGGDGSDTIVVTDATINATTKTTLALGVSGFEKVETTATSGLTIDFNALSTYDTVIASGASAVAAAAANTAGTAAINVSTIENTDNLVISAAITGGAGGVSVVGGTDVGGAGGTGIVLTPKLDNGSNIANLTFIGNADVIGGAGGASVEAADTGGAGGKALDASGIETLNLNIVGTQLSTGTADTVTFGAAAGGAAGGGTAGAAGSSITVGTNATINLTSALDANTTGAALYNNVDLGTVIGTNVTINGSTFKGNITATAASGNVTIIGGDGKDTLTGGSGTDTLTGGAGADTLDGKAGADTYTGGTGRDSFAISNSGTTAFDTVADFGKVTTALSTTQVATMSATNAFGSSIAAATSLGGDAADVLVFAATATLATAATGTDVATASSNAGKAITASISAKGVLTLAGADAALVDTVSEWVGVANAMAGTSGNVAIFEVAGNTYVFQQAGGTDTMVELIGVSGVTGAVVAGSSVAAAVGDIFVA